MIDFEAASRKERWPYCHGVFLAFPPRTLPAALASLEPWFDPISLTAIGGAAAAAMSSVGAAAAAAPLTTAGLAASAIGTGISAAGTLAGGNATMAADRYAANQYNLQAQTATAEGQRQMLDQKRQAGLVESKLQANAAAGGGDTTDPSVMAAGRQIAGRGEYNALTDLFSGQNRGAGLTDEANARIASGEAAQEGSEYGAAGTIASGVGSMFSTLGRPRMSYS